jgi:beta-galactosidase
LVITYWSGIVDENDLCFLGGWPGGGLREVLGIWDEEIDSLHEKDRNQVVCLKGNHLGLEGPYEARDCCALIHAETASVLAKFGGDFYEGRPALTVNIHGKGAAYYISSRNEESFMSDFYKGLIRNLAIRRVLEVDLPEGVTAQLRTDGEREFVFLLNYRPEAETVPLGGNDFFDLLTGRKVRGSAKLGPYGALILERI